MAAVDTTALQAQLDRSRKLTEAFQSQLKAREDAEQAKEDQSLQIASMVLSAVSKIPKANDGKNGRDGIDGIDGIHGIDGVRGLTGAKGAKGDKGDAGKDGKDGTDGINGIDGIDGKDGEAGKDGLNGRDGTNGKDGTNGEDGADGAPGEDGIDGTDGRDGIDGIDGKKGIDGVSLANIKSADSAYIFTLSNGTSYTMPLPITNTSGVIGKDGRDGKDGRPGKDGSAGKAGKEGPKGKKGDTGVGLDTIFVEKDTLHVTLSDGREKAIKLPIGSNVVAPVPSYTTPRAAAIPYNNNSSKLKATTVQEAIDVVAASSGMPSAIGKNTPEAFLYTFNLISDSHAAQFVYNGSKQLINKTIVTSNATVLYYVTYEYLAGVLEAQNILDIQTGISIDISFHYDSGLLMSKTIAFAI